MSWIVKQPEPELELDFDGTRAALQAAEEQRISERALVEAGYMPLEEYMTKWESVTTR